MNPYMQLNNLPPRRKDEVPVDIPTKTGDKTLLASQAWGFFLRHKRYPTTIDIVFHDRVVWDRWNTAEIIPDEVIVRVGVEPVILKVKVLPPVRMSDRVVKSTEAWMY